jgi:hypothetical protein
MGVAVASVRNARRYFHSYDENTLFAFHASAADEVNHAGS